MESSSPVPCASTIWSGTRAMVPNYFCNMFTLASQLHSHYTRNCNLYYIPPCRTNIRNFSVRFQEPKFFNSLSPEIQNLAKDIENPSFLVKYTLF